MYYSILYEDQLLIYYYYLYKKSIEMSRTAIFLLAGLAASATAENPFEAPWYCHTLDCPSFTNSTVNGEVQVRKYDTLLWASTDIETSNIETANSIGFNRLFEYISGANENSQTIDMTTPVLNYIQPGAGPNCNSTFTVSFFVPWSYQTEEGPPKPTSTDVYIDKKVIGEVAVTEYDGFAVSKKIVVTAEELYNDIDASTEIKVDEAPNGAYFFAGYDSPYHLNNRHNEDWINVVDA